MSDIYITGLTGRGNKASHDLNPQDVRYLVKLIKNDVKYRERKVAERSFQPVPGHSDGDKTAVAKAKELMWGLQQFLEGGA